MVLARVPGAGAGKQVAFAFNHHAVDLVVALDLAFKPYSALLILNRLAFALVFAVAFRL
jgi:hypothetical protein